MRSSVVVVVVVLALLFCSVVDAFAAPRRWVHLGSRTVTDRADHDVVEVTGQRGEFRALKFSVHKRAVEFRRVKVVFGNGSVQELELKRIVAAGSETRVIDLEGRKRVIKRIEFWYDAQSLGGQAVVKVFGKR